MFNCLNNDSKIQLRQNIKQHRQKLLQYLENTNDTVLKPKIKLISNNIEKSNLNSKRKTRSSITVKQLQPNVKVNIQEEPLSNFGLKLEPLPCIEIKDPGPSPVIVKKLKEQLIEELNYSSNSEENDDNISVGSNEDWIENFQTHNENDSSVKSKEKYSCDSDNSVLDIDFPPTRTKQQYKIKQRRIKSKKPEDRIKYNAKERASRCLISKKFEILRKCCSYLNSGRRIPSKISILLAAKKECDLLLHFNNKLVTEKNYRLKANETLQNRLNELQRR